MRSAPRKAQVDRESRKSNGAAPAESGDRAGEEGVVRQCATAIIDALPDAITVHSSDGTVLMANSRFLEIHSLEPQEVVDRSCAELFHSDEAACPHEKLGQDSRSVTLPAWSKIANRYYSIVINPVFDEAGNYSGFVRAMQDVTDRHRAQEELKKAERFATLGQMISGIAHDIGTPLNIISGYSEYLLMRRPPDAEGTKELSTILQQTRRISEFIKQMLDLARPSQGRTDAIGLKGFLSESLDLMGHHFRKSGVKVALSCADTLPLVYGDAPRLRQALFNVILNAAHLVGACGRVDILVKEADETLAGVIITLAGTVEGGERHDFSKSFARFLNPAVSEAGSMGFALAREVFDEFGARAEIAAEGQEAGSLIFYIPAQRPSQTITRS